MASTTTPISDITPNDRQRLASPRLVQVDDRQVRHRLAVLDRNCSFFVCRQMPMGTSVSPATTTAGSSR